MFRLYILEVKSLIKQKKVIPFRYLEALYLFFFASIDLGVQDKIVQRFGLPDW